ncbi:MAG: MATE family efflux transporter [Lachnospiraceae bacterium]|nr:MATE family efflux transporter [Lachnospiraceae bacterium]
MKAAKNDLLADNVTKSMLLFAAPMILGNLLQQFYNIADTLIVGKFLGSDALAAVGSSYTLMTFLTSIILGLCMGSGAVFSILYGAKKEDDMKTSFYVSFLFIFLITLLINGTVLCLIRPILTLLRIPADIFAETQSYLQVIFYGIGFTFLYNYFACLLRALGNSLVPLIFLGTAALINIGLDLLFVIVFHWGVAGAAWATITAQGFSAFGILFYSLLRVPELKLQKKHRSVRASVLKNISQYSLITCLQQSIMNFGILMIQGLVNSFGVSVMAAFAAAVKIDSFAYMPVQDFGNAFSTFIAQNYGARQTARIREGIRSAIRSAFIFCLVISAVVCLFAPALMRIFVQPHETEVIAIGVQYLRIEGACYCGIGCLFLLYGLYRGMDRPGMSVILTVISLGTRVLLAYLLAPIPAIGLPGIWWAIPIGWFLADAAGLLYYRHLQKRLKLFR